MSKLNGALLKSLNSQLHKEYQAAFMYKHASYYFDHAMFGGIAKFFQQESQEEFAHAVEIESYILSRRVTPVHHKIDIVIPKWEKHLDVFKSGLEIEAELLNKISTSITEAHNHEDHHLAEFWVKFLDHQYAATSKMEGLVKQVESYEGSPGLMYHLNSNII